MQDLQREPEAHLRHAALLQLKLDAPVAPRAQARASSVAAGAVAVLVVLVMVGGSLAFEITWSADVAAWLVLATTFTGVGVAVALRVPGNAFGWVLLAIGVASAFTVGTWSGEAPVALVWVRSWLMYVPVGLLPVALLLFPTGRLFSAHWRAPLAVAVAGVAAPTFFLAVASTIEPDPLGFFGPPAGAAVDGLLFATKIGSWIGVVALLLAVSSLFVRLRSAPDIERRQVACLLLGALVLFAGLALSLVGYTGAWIAGTAALPIAAGVAILWHRLYDLDLFMNRTLVRAGLGAALVASFAGAVVAIGTLIDVGPASRTAALVAVALVALGLDPLRRRLQRGVDRVLYGHRDDPYEVVTALGRGLGSSSTSPTTVLTDAAEAVARSLALPYVAIEVASPDGASVPAEWGRRFGQPIGLPLTYRGEPIGRLLVTPRTVGGELGERDRRLLQDVAHSVAMTVKAVELSAGLQQAREQLVTTREEERRRLRRDLHDGLGPTLAGMVMQLDAASNVLPRDPGAVEPVLGVLRAAAQDAIADIRRLVYELRPPALDELGLVGAIREWTDRFSSPDEAGLQLSLDAPTLPPLPAAVEVAALRIVQEAITNVVRHSHARVCSVRLAAAAALEVEVDDDGRGLAADRRAGVGLTSMSERAAELGGTCTITSPAGGGTCVRATLPLPS
jgi:signal transduction histidine kinase